MQRPSDAQPVAAQASLASYIEEQPWATDMAFTAAAELRTSGWLSRTEAGLALVGSGSSYNALLASRPGLSQASAGPVSVHGAEDYLREFASTRRQQKLIVLSQSGNSRTSVAAARAVLALLLITPVMVVLPPADVAEASTGKFCKWLAPVLEPPG